MNPTTVVLGVGAENGIGFQCAKLFRAQGHDLVICGRNAERLGSQAAQIGAEARVLDAADATAVDALFADLPTLNTVIHNVGVNIRRTFDEMDATFFERMWRDNSLSAFNVARAAAQKMTFQGQGNILFTSASAALRGKPGFAAFASTRGGNRLMIQALAKELGPQGVHVAQVIVDGIVNGQRALDRWAHVVEGLGEDGTVDPAAVADTFWFLANQPRSAWTHEIDLRPFKEEF